MTKTRRAFIKSTIAGSIGTSFAMSSCNKRQEKFQKSKKPENGILHLPKGIGSGVEIDPEFIDKHKIIQS
jgi:hypothetical protein